MPTVRTAPPRTRVLVLGLATATLAGGLVAAPAQADDDPTPAQAKKARKAAQKRVPGRVVSIERNDDGRVRYEVRIITKGNRVREVDLTSRYRVVRVEREGRDGLTYTRVGRASAAALKVVRGIVIDVDREDNDDRGYEVEVLRSNGTARTVDLTASFRVSRDDDSDDD